MIIRVLTIIMLASFGLTGLAQEDRSFKYESFSVMPIGWFTAESSITGYAAGLDLNFRAGKKRFAFAMMAGTEFEIFGTSATFTSAELLYGYNFKVIPRIEIDLMVGLGTFKFDPGSNDFLSSLNFFAANPKAALPNPENFNKIRLGIPVQAKVRIRTGPRFTLSLLGSYKFNDAVSFYVLGLGLQWNPRSRE